MVLFNLFSIPCLYVVFFIDWYICVSTIYIPSFHPLVSVIYIKALTECGTPLKAFSQRMEKAGALAPHARRSPYAESRPEVKPRFVCCCLMVCCGKLLNDTYCIFNSNIITLLYPFNIFLKKKRKQTKYIHLLKYLVFKSIM